MERCGLRVSLSKRKGELGVVGVADDHRAEDAFEVGNVLDLRFRRRLGIGTGGCLLVGVDGEARRQRHGVKKRVWRAL